MAVPTFRDSEVLRMTERILTHEDMGKAHARYLKGFADVVSKMHADLDTRNRWAERVGSYAWGDIAYREIDEARFDWYEILADLVEDMVDNARKKGWIES